MRKVERLPTRDCEAGYAPKVAEGRKHYYYTDIQCGYEDATDNSGRSILLKNVW